MSRAAVYLRRAACLGLLIWLAACAGPAPMVPPPAADHHVHLRSEIAAVDLPRVQLARGHSRHELSPGYQDADALIRRLDEQGIRHAAILSLGYMYALPDIDFEDEYVRVRRENDFTAEQAARYPRRLVAFCGVSPLADYALAEITRCAKLPVVGIKMHMANSGVDPDQASHFQALADAVAQANALGLSLVIHLRPRGKHYDSDWVERFVDEIMPLAPDVTVQLAHLGGGGGMDTQTRRAVAVLARAVDDHPGLYFDLSGTFLRDQDIHATRSGPTIERQNRWAVADAIRRLGTDRVLFGSDWDSLEYDDTLTPIRRLPGLDQAGMDTIMRQRAPYFRALETGNGPGPGGRRNHEK